MSVDDWADLWLNGIPIVDSQPHTPLNADTKIIRAKPNSLCYFSRENLLAIEITKTTIKNKFDLDPSVGFAYILKLKLSDGREILLTSNEADQHKALYLPDQGISEPFRWNDRFFNDASWVSSFSTSFHLPSCAVVKDPESGALAEFLSARSASPQSLHPGERHLFRRYFSLPILPNPLCLTPIPVPWKASHVVEKVPSPTPGFLLEAPAIVLPEGPRHPQMPRVPRPTPTWTFLPTATRTFTPVPYSQFVPVSTPTLSFLRAPWPLHSTSLEAIPTATPVVGMPIPTPIKKTPKIQILHPTWVVQVFTPTATIFWEYRPPTATLTAMPVLPVLPTATTISPPVDSQAQTLEVAVVPANLYVSFADGPGIYRLVVFDSQGRFIRNLYEMKVTTQTEDWAVWDGKDESGQDAPPGYYRVVFTQNGVRLKDVILHLGAGNP